MQSVPQGRAARPEDCVLSRARISYTGTPCVLPGNDHRTPTTSGIAPNPL
jgi:hypothetical protein